MLACPNLLATLLKVLLIKIVCLAKSKSCGVQLSFLEPYQDQKVLLEVILVNWNGKYSIQVISVIDNNQKIVCDYNFKD